MSLPKHLFIDSCGDLYDTRVTGWYNLPPLRRQYRTVVSKIESVADLKATLRAGPYARPGGYPMFFHLSDGEALSFESARKEARSCFRSIKEQADDGWRIVVTDINYEDHDLYCAHSGEKIEAAYSPEDAEDDDLVLLRKHLRYPQGPNE